MNFLLLSLSFALGIIITFKMFPRFKISITQAISANYITASVLGFMSVNNVYFSDFYTDSSWIYVSVISGICLLAGFYVFSATVIKTGAAIGSVSSRVSVVIPVILSVLLFEETLSFLKISGIMLAIFSFYLIFRKDKYKIEKNLIVFPLLLFFASGINDSLLKYAQYFYIDTDIAYIKFLFVSFSVSFIFSLIILSGRLILKKEFFQIKNIIAGIILGIFNWYSILFFMKGLGQMDVSVFIPVFNAGHVSLSAFAGVLIFKEKLNKINILGLIIATVAVVIIAYADSF